MAATDLVPLEKYTIVEKGEEGFDLLRETLEGQDVSEFDLPRVSVPTGGATTWEVPGLTGDDSMKEIQGVVVFYKNSRSFWTDPYAGGNEPPNCSARDAKHAVADEDTEIPAQRDEETGKLLCETCAHSEWGSSETGSGRGQACKLTRQLFLIAPDRMLPLVVNLPPTSLKRASNYFLNLANYNKDYRKIVTRIGLEKTSGNNVPDYSVATFLAGDDLDEKTAEFIAKYADVMRGAFEAVTVRTAAEVGGTAEETSD